MRWHRAVFGGLFRRDAGRTRRPYEDVVFSNVYMDRQGIEFQMVFHGSPGNDIEPRLQTACSAFAVVQQRHADGNAALSEVATELARLIAQILVIHPFVDGNHRIALVAVQAVIRDITGTIAVIPDNQGLGADLELALLGEAYIAPLAGRLLAALDPSS